MTWLLIVTAIVNGQPVNTAPVPFKTQAECMHVLKIVEQNEVAKAYKAKAVCEKIDR